MKRIALAAVVSAVSIVLTLLALELGLSLLHPVPFALAAALTVDSDPFTGYRLRPGSPVRYHRGIRSRVNSQGRRGEEVAPDKAGAFRILVLGDSFTFGTDVREEEAFPRVLESLLNQRGGPRAQVINAGVPGWSPFQYAQYYEHYGRQLDPDLVIVGFFVGNDAYSPHTRLQDVRLTAAAGKRVSRQAATDRWLAPKILLYEHSHLARLVFNRGLMAESDFTRSDCSDFTESLLAAQRETLRVHRPRSHGAERAVSRSARQVARVHRMAAEAGIPCLVVLIPTEAQVNPELQRRLVAGSGRSAYDFGMPNTLLRELLASRRIPVLDLLPAFRREPSCLYMNDTHWNPLGHRLAAERIAARLRDNDSGGWMP